MRIYEMVAILQSFPDDRAEVVVGIRGQHSPINYVVRALEGDVILGTGHTSLAGVTAPVLDS